MKIQALQDKNDIATLKTQVSAIKKEILETLYPINSIYITMDGINPKTRFGFGTWSLIQDRFLVGAGSTVPDVNLTGGSWNHSHALNNCYVPMYIGSQNMYYRSKENANFNTTIKKDIGAVGSYVAETSTGMSRGIAIDGSTDTNNSLPPYISVYIWKRTA